MASIESFGGAFARTRMARRIVLLFVPCAIVNDPSRGGLCALARAIDAKSHWTAGHSDRVTAFSLALGQRLIVPIVLHPNERWDGVGYPKHLAGDDIPYLARVLSLADAYDALTSDRPYRAGMSHEKALTRIEAGLGTQFDPAIGRVFVALVREDGPRVRPLDDPAPSAELAALAAIV